MSVAALTRLDLDAAALAKRWGVTLNPTVVLVPASPCQRQDCGGSVLSLSGGTACLLCSRPFGRPDHTDMERELARETGLRGLAVAVLGGGN